MKSYLFCYTPSPDAGKDKGFKYDKTKISKGEEKEGGKGGGGT